MLIMIIFIMIMMTAIHMMTRTFFEGCPSLLYWRGGVCRVPVRVIHICAGDHHYDCDYDCVYDCDDHDNDFDDYDYDSDNYDCDSDD